jgi:ribosomal protein S18 acetylase RimI-like enzyme
VTGYFDAAPRSLRPEDAQPTRVLLIGTLGITPYIDRALEVLELAERAGGHSQEYRALIIERDGTVAGLAVFGATPGTQGAARLHAVALAPTVAASDVGQRLIDAVADALRKDRARFLLAEMADDSAIGHVLTMLREQGFAEESRIPDFFRDGVALTFLRRSL